MTRASIAERIAQALVRNCRAYTEGGKPFPLFVARNRRLWDIAQRAGAADAVRALVTPPLVAAYPRWARETGLAS